MYEKDKRQRITLRLTDEQFQFIRVQTDMLGITPSDYLRMVVNSLMFTANNGTKTDKAALEFMEALGRENDEANRND